MIDAVANDLKSVIEAQRHFIARWSTTWSGSTSPADQSQIATKTSIGFTSETTSLSMGLVNLNGRMLDSVTGRMLSPDPQTPNPGNTQSWNHYSYVNNNPLSFTDPSGFYVCPGFAPATTCPEANAAIAQGVAENQKIQAEFNAWAFSVADLFNGWVGVPAVDWGAAGQAPTVIGTGLSQSPTGAGQQATPGAQIDILFGSSNASTAGSNGRAGNVPGGEGYITVCAGDYVCDVGGPGGHLQSADGGQLAANIDYGPYGTPFQMTYDLGKVLIDFEKVSTWPVRIFTPFGRGADTLLGYANAGVDVWKGNLAAAGVTVGSDLYGRAWEAILKPFGGNIAGSIGALMSNFSEITFSSPGGPQIDLSSDAPPQP